MRSQKVCKNSDFFICKKKVLGKGNISFCTKKTIAECLHIQYLKDDQWVHVCDTLIVPWLLELDKCTVAFIYIPGFNNLGIIQTVQKNFAGYDYYFLQT